MGKIKNPVVLIHRRENSDTYAVAITSGSQNYHDAVLMAAMEPDMIGDDVNTWSKTGYYMAAEIETLRLICSEAYQCVGVLADRCGTLDDMGFIKLLDNLSQMKLVHDDLLPFQLSFCEKSGLTHAADARQSGSNPATVPGNDVTTGKPLTITLPDITSKAFWSGTRKSETFHPETYKRWVKEAIERACVIARIGVEVK